MGLEHRAFDFAITSKATCITVWLATYPHWQTGESFLNMHRGFLENPGEPSTSIKVYWMLHGQSKTSREGYRKVMCFSLDTDYHCMRVHKASYSGTWDLCWSLSFPHSLQILLICGHHFFSSSLTNLSKAFRTYCLSFACVHYNATVENMVNLMCQ